MRKIRITRKKAILYMAGCLFLISCQGKSSSTPNSTMAEISPVGQYLQAGASIIDVRTAAEFQSGNFPKSRNIPLQEIESRISEFGDKNSPIILYCRSGSRSARALQILQAAGYQKVVNGGGLDDMLRRLP